VVGLEEQRNMSVCSMVGRIQKVPLSSRDKWWLWGCGVE
jgi:hypothetical protein